MVKNKTGIDVFVFSSDPDGLTQSNREQKDQPVQ
jgi:hypothetical protein